MQMPARAGRRACAVGCDVVCRVLRSVVFSALALGVPSVACSPPERPDLPACKLEVTVDDRGDLALAILVANPGVRDEIGQYSSLLDAMTLSVTELGAGGGEPIAVTRGAETGRPVGDGPRSLNLRPRSGTRLEPPVRLRFAGSASAEPGPDLAVWKIEHAPAALRIQVDLAIEGLMPRQCVAEYRPAAARTGE